MEILQGLLFVLTFNLVSCQRREIHSGYGSPVSQSLDIALPFANPRQDGGPLGAGLAGEPPVPPPQNTPVSPLDPVGGPLGGPPNGGLVPFGLNHIILIVVPQFKTKLRKLPAWLTSTVKISMPITVFFDQLNAPPGMFVPGIGGLNLPLPFPPPIGPPPPGGFGPLPPFPPTGISSVSSSAPAPPPSHEHQSMPSYPQTVYQQYENNQGYTMDDSEQSDLEVSYDDSYYPEEEIKRRYKRSVWVKPSYPNIPYKKQWKAVKFNETVHAAERAALIPKIENLLENAGFGGKSCLLRAICEVHEAPLNHYGLLGELFTMLFSVSKSAFAETHLPEYLLAEASGKTGDCTEYHRHCQHSIFLPLGFEKGARKRTASDAFIINEIDEVL